MIINGNLKIVKYYNKYKSLYILIYIKNAKIIFHYY